MPNKDDIKEGEWQWFSLPLRPDVFDHYKLINALIKAIKQFCIYPNEYVKIRKNGYEYKLVFSWGDQDAPGIEIYRRLIPGN